MREIRTGMVEGAPNAELGKVAALDEAGPGGASHEYGMGPGYRQVVKFQKGPVLEEEMNGVGNEALLAVVMDRLEGFQRGEFACGHNAEALYHCRMALSALKGRTVERMGRGVCGKSVR